MMVVMLFLVHRIIPITTGVPLLRRIPLALALMMVWVGQHDRPCMYHCWEPEENPEQHIDEKLNAAPCAQKDCEWWQRDSKQGKHDVGLGQSASG